MKPYISVLNKRFQMHGFNQMNKCLPSFVTTVLPKKKLNEARFFSPVKSPGLCKRDVFIFNFF